MPVILACYSQRQKVEGRGQKAEGLLLIRGRLDFFICPNLYGDSYRI